MTAARATQNPETHSFPLSDSELQRYRLQLDRRASTVPPGTRLMQKRGQSLEFREYDAFQPGDDVRFVDWRLSLSRGAPWELWKKTFDTEEAARIVVTIDQSATLDENSGKSLVSAWLAEAVSRVALLGRDRVLLHRMRSAHERGPSSGSSPAPTHAAGSGDTWRGRFSELRGHAAVSGLCEMRDGSIDEATCAGGLSSVFHYLKPGVLWLIVSDFLASPTCLQQLAASVTAAQQQRAAVAVIELDSWPWERSLVAGCPVRVTGPGIDPDDDRLKFEADHDLLDRIAVRIEANRAAFFRRAPMGSFRSRWSWPALERPSAQLNLQTLFRDWFTSDPVVRSLLMTGESR